MMLWSYWTPKAYTAQENTLPEQCTNPRAPKATLDALQGSWDHSSLPLGVVVSGEEVVVGKKRHTFQQSQDGLVTEVCGYLLDGFEGDSVRWISKEGGHSCTWTRRPAAPKRKRVLSGKLMEAERDAEEVKSWLAHQRRGVHTAKRKAKPRVEKEPEPVKEPPKPKEAKPEVKISKSELRRYLKALQRREKWKDQDDRGFSGHFKHADSDDDERVDGPGWLHTSKHNPAEWGGWHRLAPHTLSFQVLEHLAKDNFPVAKSPKKHPSPSKLALETRLTITPVLTLKSAREYKQSYACLEFLADQAAWPDVTRKQMHAHIASNKCATYVYWDEAGEIAAAAMLKVKQKQGRKVCWIEFIRANNSRPRRSPSRQAHGKHKQQIRPVPLLMQALDRKLGPLFDKLVLQVHSENQSALERFESTYGFVRDSQYDEQLKGQTRCKLIGMCKHPKKAVRARVQPVVEPQNTTRKRPKRAAVRGVNYRDPDDPGLTVEDFCR